ncbi:hypothetical protein ACEPAF_3065 [Sanghuangporus sanghuang]
MKNVRTCLGTGNNPILSSNRWFGRHHCRHSLKLFANSQFVYIPIIAGANLDEGTTFVPTATESTAQIQQAAFAATSPSPVSSEEQASVINTILQMYPDDPALGSAFGTGNEIFGLSAHIKRAAAILCKASFTSLRRSIAQTANVQGVKVFAYLFADPQAATLPAYVGVEHGLDKAYVLDPNDTLGNSTRPLSSEHTTTSQSDLQLNSANTLMVPDTFRDDQISFLMVNPEVLLP